MLIIQTINMLLLVSFYSLFVKVFMEKMREMPTLKTTFMQCVGSEVYDSDIYTKYSKEEIEKVESFIDHDRDFLFTYAGLRQVVDKYLVQDRSNGGVYETPQFMYIMIALTIFREYPKATRGFDVKKYYDAISKHRINIPTPIMAGKVRTPSTICSFCVLVDVDDTLDSIFSSDMDLLVVMLLKGQESVSTQSESVASTVKSGAEKFNTQVLFLFLKSLNQLSAAVHRMNSRWVSNCPLPNLAPRNRRHHRSEE